MSSTCPVMNAATGDSALRLMSQMLRQTPSASSPPAWLQLITTSAPAEAGAGAIARPLPRALGEGCLSVEQT